MRKIYRRIRTYFKLKTKQMILPSKEQILPFLNSRTEFATVGINDLKAVHLNMYRSNTNVFNQEWIDWNIKALINKVSDGHPRYVYVGVNYMPVDGAQLFFSYRGNSVYISHVAKLNVPASIITMDKTNYLATTGYMIWQFIGYEIDRGA